MRFRPWLLLILLAGCRSAEDTPDPVPARLQAARPVNHVYAVLLNGGGSKGQNFRSHLLHVQQLFAQLERAGVDRGRITIFSSDGDDPEADVALRDRALPDKFWLLDGTRLEFSLRPAIVFENTVVADVSVRPATRAALAEWFGVAAIQLQPGDTLLLYVTDHGGKNPENTANNRITLWGHDEALSVEQLSALLLKLDPGVRVVSVMSQCYSGAFAGLALATAGSDRPAGNLCGYFSSTAERPAYGCYPENRGRDNVGHSFHFLEAFASSGRLADAHAETLVADATPDVPLRTSDHYLEDLLTVAAARAGVEYAALVDDLLATAWRDRGAWEPELRLLDRIGNAFGVFSPRSFAELDEQKDRIDAMVEQLKTHGRAWGNARESLARENLDRFLAAQPSWAARVEENALGKMPREDVDALGAELLGEMGAAVARDPATAERFDTLTTRADAAQAIGYRMEVREGVVLRLRTILASIAGRVYLATQGSPYERDTYAALRTCEDLEIPVVPIPAESALARVEPFPLLADDVQLAGSVLPAWMGIQFRQAKDALRTRHHLAEGAAAVLMTSDDSPARAAGLREGDVVLGPPGSPFVEKDQIREWIMRSAPGTVASLEILRDGARQVVSLVPSPMPQKWPSLPGPPKVGSIAPPLRVDSYRGTAPTTLADGRPRILFFWATWCGICKTAVPELLAFEKARGVQAIAITDEDGAELDPFFTIWKDPFPATVVSDQARAAFRNYGVSGTPTFVMVDDKGVVQSYSTGYSKAKGLRIDGWQWDEPRHGG
ncbi:MAG: redoxin family protein [Candidatus Binatia bacterium]